MGHDDLREIFERLEALERGNRSRSGGRGDREDHHRGGRDRHDDDRHHRDHHHRDRHDRDHDHRGRGDGEFNEKRVIDTIVRLVGERVERGVQDQIARTQRRDDGGNEKRIVDLVVRLVGERVREIVREVVADELDRRVGGPRDDRPTAGPSEADEH